MLNVDIGKLLDEGWTTEQIMKAMQNEVDHEVTARKRKEEKENKDLVAARRTSAEAQYEYAKALGILDKEDLKDREGTVQRYYEVMEESEESLVGACKMLDDFIDKFSHKHAKAKTHNDLDRIINEFVSRL